MLCIEDAGEFIVLFRVFYGLKYGLESDQLETLVRSPYFRKIFNEAFKGMMEKLNNLESIDQNQVNSYRT